MELVCYASAGCAHDMPSTIPSGPSCTASHLVWVAARAATPSLNSPTSPQKVSPNTILYYANPSLDGRLVRHRMHPQIDLNLMFNLNFEHILYFP